MPEEMWFTQIDNGILAGEKITPITSAGLYVPRGKGAFPSADGGADDATLFSAEVCGIKNVYKVGGAQAIAAMAYGTDTIPKVNKDVGTPAGPIESIILCDETVEPAIAALDLLIEAEHGPDSCALLVTHSEELAAKVEALLPDLINDLPEERQNFCNTVLSNYGGIVLTENLEASVQFVNYFAPEHLEVLVEAPMSILSKIVNAGVIMSYIRLRLN